jgi:hypothetical protein
MSDFKKSQEAAYRRLVRGAVRKGPFTKSERDVILAIVNHWFHHKAKGKMHPSRGRIAQKAEVSERTVQRMFSFLRDAGVLVPQSNLIQGRGKSTEYRLDDLSLMQLCGVDMEKIITAMTPKKGDSLSSFIGEKKETPCPPVYKNVAIPIHDPDFVNSNVVTLPKVVGGGDV